MFRRASVFLIFIFVCSGFCQAADSQAIRQTVQAIFTPDSQGHTPKTTRQLIDTALNKNPNLDWNINQNIRSNALWYLEDRLKNPSDLELIRRYRADFNAELEKKENGWLRTSLSDLVLKISDPADITSASIIDLLSETNIVETDEATYKTQEKKAIDLVRLLVHRPADGLFILHNLPPLLEKQLHRDLGACTAALDVMNEYVSDAGQSEIDNLVKTCDLPGTAGVIKRRLIRTADIHSQPYRTVVFS